ncbi:hypothetical protein CL653_02155 [bacterium]|nr:hypothetical protein [bacterium]|tara:strand:+ start:1240 stop:2238 length:999 start_codon:yes stop_codon:yes gene_type:complete
MKENTILNKSLTVVGLIAILILAVWLAVKIVGLIPNAFTSLASIADGVYNSRPVSELNVATEASLINTGEEVTIHWEVLRGNGTYTFSYQCSDGVSLIMKYPDDNETYVPCGQVIKLGNNTFSLTIIPTAERVRFSDVLYSIGFIKAGTDEIATEKTNRFTVVNPDITQSRSVSILVPEDNTYEPEVSELATTIPGTPTVTTTEVYELPSSDPNGFVDLAVKYLGVGTLNSQNQFVPRGTIDNDSRGAFQFEVKNVGTKTSASWDFAATLPSGTKYESPTQAGLKPNERSVITLGFDNVGQTGTRTFGAEINVSADTSSRNDSFSWAVTVTD